MAADGQTACLKGLLVKRSRIVKRLMDEPEQATNLLVMASMNGRGETLNFLLEVLPFALNDLPVLLTTLSSAVYAKQFHIVAKFVAKTRDPKSCGQFDVSLFLSIRGPLFLKSVEYDYPFLLKEMFGAGYDPLENGRELAEKSFITAAEEGHLKCLEILLEKIKADKAIPSGKDTPLMKAAGEGHVECLRALIPNVNIDRTNKKGESALHVAIQRGHFECAMVLLEASADVNATMKNGTSALSLACQLGEACMVQRMLHAGADPFYSSKGKEVALHVAVEHKESACIEVLLNAMLKDESQRMDALKFICKAFTIAEKEQQNAIIRHEMGEDHLLGEELMRFMAKEDSSKELDRLLSSWRDREKFINEFDDEDMTVLMHACKHGSLDSVGILANKGAKIELQNKAGLSALKVAQQVRGSRKGHKQCIKFLEKRLEGMQPGKSISNIISI